MNHPEDACFDVQQTVETPKQLLYHSSFLLSYRDQVKPIPGLPLNTSLYTFLSYPLVREERGDFLVSQPSQNDNYWLCHRFKGQQCNHCQISFT